jgi:hypothetical protein
MTGASLLVVVVAFLEATPIVVTDSEGNTWTPLSEYASGAANGRVRMYYVENPTVAADQEFSITGTAFQSAVIAGFSNIATVSAFDKENGAGSASAATQQPGSVTPANNNALLVTGLEFVSASGNASIDSDFILIESIEDGGNFACAMAYKVQTTAGAENPTWASNAAADRITANIAVFNHG